MIIYNQTGQISFGNHTYPAYSGHGIGKNNHAYEKMQNIGPIPCGEWEIAHWDDHHGDKGPQVAVLLPVKHNAWGRTAFLIHGDSISRPGEASHGCIIASRYVRDKLRASGERQLTVIPGKIAPDMTEMVA